MKSSKKVKTQHQSVFILQAILFLTLTTSIIGCQKTEIIVPSDETVYLFPFQTKVDAKQITCGHHISESLNDKFKKEMREEVNSVNLEQQVAIGNEFHRSIAQELTFHSKHAWGKEIVNNMRPFLSNQNFKHHVYVIRDTAFNAYTLPGGNIYLTTGLLNLVETKEQLAFVIGHELGHNENNHTKESAIAYLYYNQSDEDASFLEKTKKFGTMLGKKLTNKSNELECDISSMYLAYKAGYDPEKVIEGVELLKKISDAKPNKKWKAFFYGLLRSHPWSEDRVNCVSNYVNTAKVEVKCGKIYAPDPAIVITKTTPLGLYEYPSRQSTRKYEVPKGETIYVVCDGVESGENTIDWFHIAYLKDNEVYQGWSNRKYIKLIQQ